MLKLDNKQVCNGYKYNGSSTIMVLRLKNHVKQFNTNTLEVFAQN